MIGLMSLKRNKAATTTTTKLGKNLEMKKNSQKLLAHLKSDITTSSVLQQRQQQQQQHRQQVAFLKVV
jgi:hypothetical protein